MSNWAFDRRPLHQHLTGQRIRNLVLSSFIPLVFTWGNQDPEVYCPGGDNQTQHSNYVLHLTFKDSYTDMKLWGELFVGFCPAEVKIYLLKTETCVSISI